MSKAASRSLARFGVAAVPWSAGAAVCRAAASQGVACHVPAWVHCQLQSEHRFVGFRARSLSLAAGWQIMGDTGGLDGPDARLAFLYAVMDPNREKGGYTADQMSDPEKYLPLVAQAYPMYLRHLQVRLSGPWQT